MYKVLLDAVLKRLETFRNGILGSPRRKTSGSEARKDPVNLNADRVEDAHRKEEDGWIRPTNLHSIEAS
ncbi:hypothetical protein FIBSPDRAFT_872901 [Athelia psychrophila]|uniref:Uncharacterized protein n=1 Tax=Athelia psychrophila TaxID=1759441 RepID=A0A165Z298_9AGAM|nr:hypothetical protein FIBSPDRAFT_872901 [Fibularhizoctonia sp. CBS 109695]